MIADSAMTKHRKRAADAADERREGVSTKPVSRSV